MVPLSEREKSARISFSVLRCDGRPKKNWQRAILQEIFTDYHEKVQKEPALEIQSRIVSDTADINSLNHAKFWHVSNALVVWLLSISLDSSSVIFMIINYHQTFKQPSP